MTLTATQTGAGWDVDETTGGSPVIARDGNGDPTGLVDPNTGLPVGGAPSDGVLFTKSGQKIKLVAGVMRNLNDGNGWQLITNSTHTNCNVESITQTSSAINVNFPSLGGAKVISFVAVPDETLAKAGFTMGSSVTTSQASIELKRRKAVADYISYNGSAWTSATSVFTFAFSAGTLTLTHPTVETSDGLVVSVTGRDGVYDAQAGTAAATTTQVKFYDWAGTLQTTENTNMKAYVNRGVASAASDPATVNESTFPGGNIWFMGVFEMP